MTIIPFPLPATPAADDWWTPADDMVVEQERLADAGYFDADNDDESGLRVDMVDARVAELDGLLAARRRHPTSNGDGK